MLAAVRSNTPTRAYPRFLAAIDRPSSTALKKVVNSIVASG
jgi:hypothetical protein